MKICSKCKVVADDRVCPSCGRNKFLSEAKEDDLVIVTTAGYVSSFLVEDILKDSGINYIKKGALGSAVTIYVGEMTESYNFFVMAKDYDNARSVMPDFELSDDDILEE